MTSSADSLNASVCNQAHAERVAWLDGWRGYGLSCVLVSHFGGPFFLGQYGVDAFFALSGLLIASMLFLRQQPLVVFAVRRAARILPAFLVFVSVIYIVYVLLAGLVVDPRSVIATLTFSRAYWPADQGVWIPDPLPLAHLWSLNVEEHSYAGMAVIAWVVRRRARLAGWLLVAGALICCIFYVRYRYHPPGSSMPYTIRTECAAYPLLLAWGLHLLSHAHGWRAPGWLPIAALMLSLVLGASLSSKASITLVVVPTLLVIALVSLYTSGDAIARWLRTAYCIAPLRWLGVASFSIYLWQQPAHWHLRQGDLAPGVMAVVSLILSVLFGWLMYTMLERPARHWLVRRLTRSTC